MLEEKIDALFDVVNDLAIDMTYVKSKVDVIETEMDRRFEIVDEKFMKMDTRFAAMDEKFAEIEARF